MSDRTVLPADAVQRQRALEVTGSCIVQAPAGSGKTELLIQRILALLATVSHPEEILAITFTRKAAAEMRKRLLDALEAAAGSGPEPELPHAARTRALARAVMERNAEYGWCLLDNPNRFQVMTIDSFCGALVRRMPYLARFGESAAIAEEPSELHRKAAERLLGRLERNGEGWAAIELLLGHLDNNLPQLRNLIVAMLGRRDQWLRHLDPANSAAARPDLENSLRRQVLTSLASLRSSLDADLLSELCALGAWAAGNLARLDSDNALAALLDRSAPPTVSIEDLPAWLALGHLTLTGEGRVRAAVNVTLGFPAGRELADRDMKTRILKALERLRVLPGAVEKLKSLRFLPATTYSDGQWEVLAALIELLPLADKELRAVFRDSGKVDFTEISRGAVAALGDELAPGELLLHLDSRLRHVLVDEFQDTSRGQFELLAKVTSGWEQGDGRTLFVVGDPMQSIYRFREAEVGLFLRTRTRGFETVQLEPLALQANFRSRPALVSWFNEAFAELFPASEDEMRGAITFSAAIPVREAGVAPAVTMSCCSGRDDGAEAARIIGLIQEARAANPEQTVAVLVRSRAHLSSLVKALKGAGIPWQAQDIDPLTSRPVIRDLLALTRALLHPADRVAWLSVLRAPWCGLRLDDLLALCGHDPDVTVWECLIGQDEQPRLFQQISDDALERLRPVTEILGRSLACKGRVPLRRLIESAWLELKGPAGLDSGGLADAGRYFALLDELDVGCDLVRLETLDERLASLFAVPDPQAGPQLQLMTIHKAKGLEFDTVILPGLGRSVRPPERPLLLWQEQIDQVRGDEGLLLAPIPASCSDEPDPTYQAIARIHADKDRLETLRLFYVAATRAKERLHLLGHAGRGSDGTLVPSRGSLLEAAWPALRPLAEGNVIDVPSGAVVEVSRGLPLQRLPRDWSAPPLQASLPTPVVTARRASDSGHHGALATVLTLRAEEGRIVGTAVHGWLERFSREGVDNWPDQRAAGIRPDLLAYMVSSGIPGQRAERCADRALQGLIIILNSARGRWILAPHRAAASELALTGIIDGVPVHAVIDRTFIDENGVRWVIDYKTSSPDDDEDLEDFLGRERERYAPQLEDYRKLLAIMEAPAEIRAALYFPMIDGWCEIG